MNNTYGEVNYSCLRDRASFTDVSPKLQNQERGLHYLKREFQVTVRSTLVMSYDGDFKVSVCGGKFSFSIPG